MNEPIATAAPAGRSGVAVATGIGACVLVVMALYLASAVFAPLTIALLIMAMVWPLQERLERRLPKLVALAISVVATIVVIGGLLLLAIWGFSRVGRYAVAEAAQFQQFYTGVVAWLQDHGIEASSLWAEHFNASAMIRVIQQITARINGVLGFGVVVLIYVILGLLEVRDFGDRFRALRNRELGSLLYAGSARTAAKLRRYMWVRTQMSLVTGALVSCFILACGLPLAMEWGVMAFVLNYIPFIGPLIATVLPTVFATVQFQSWQMAVVVFAGLNLVQFLVGSYLEPRVAGKVLSMSPLLVLFAVFFWMFLWGLTGAFIGIPIVIAGLTLCEESTSGRWVSDLFGAGPEAAK
jgi:AI-2 transport protein TqsA